MKKCRLQRRLYAAVLNARARRHFGNDSGKVLCGYVGWIRAAALPVAACHGSAIGRVKPVRRRSVMELSHASRSATFTSSAVTPSEPEENDVVGFRVP
ncbi:hypothetical protein EYF80_053054 [Liparis tanakae]|uniref:Uncharacterized protein n=1 Tax=Liparis tanakae TaxID=230148 RepID=A0A4Z2F7J5_9TELE|nr:hypothetical protein EYF80_053054 [Liparis tanakae]